MLLSIALSLAASWTQAPAQAPEAAQTPRLIVLLAIDQFIPEQLLRMESQLDGGLGRIVHQGVRFEEAALPYSCTETGPGHATMSTGCLPRTHGIVGNRLRSRDTGETSYCVADPEARDVTDAGIGTVASVSAHNLGKPSLGDYLKAKNPASKVFSVSGKDRSAVCMAGHHGDLALWWSDGGGFQTSTGYAQVLPGYVTRFNAGWARRFAGYVWNPSLDAEHLPPHTAPDDREGEGSFPGGGRTFPHAFEGSKDAVPEGDKRVLLSRQVQYSPVGDTITLEMARQLVVENDLGADDVPDFLGVSLSGPDKLGHTYGPYSLEVTDSIVHIDHDLAGLFQLLDERVGADHWVLALTADHGVLPLPESEVTIPGVESKGRIEASAIQLAQKHVAEALAEAFGTDDKGRGLRPHFFDGDVYFELGELKERGIDGAEARRVAAATIAKEPWVHAAYTLEQLASKDPTDDPLLGFYRNAYDPRYSADVSVLQLPGWLKGWQTGTTHGTPYAYDRRLPLYFLGSPFRSGAVHGEAGSQDIVPTLLHLVGIDPAGVDGHLLRSALR
ncbi:MAG: alkaline phosphatase family protein [Planctomycetes bacterium]|nr:alkaline phosphatase family protein [Planctomycetota bacterium]HPF13621.1 alkaline phosphatase family protein [Planctomycetota bacterium]